MTVPHVFVETNFLFGVFHMPSKRHRDALALKARVDAAEVRLYVPYVSFQEARNKITRSLPKYGIDDLWEFHRFAVSQKTASWDIEVVKKFLDAATAELRSTKARCHTELSGFATAIGDGVLHGTKEVFDLLQSFELEDDPGYNDK